jgi:hypothetical protein
MSEPIVIDIGGCLYGEESVRALAIDTTEADVDTGHDGQCRKDRELLARGCLAMLAELRDRRSRDLTADEVEALKWLKRALLDEVQDEPTLLRPDARAGYDVLSKLLSTRSE